MRINKEYIGGWSIFFFCIGFLSFIAQPNLGSILLILVGIWYIPKYHNFCTSKIKLKERIMNANKNTVADQNTQNSKSNEMALKITYRLYDFAIRFIVFMLIVGNFQTYFAPQAIYYAKPNICIYNDDLKPYKRLKQFEKISIYPTIKKDYTYYETSDHDYVRIDDVMNECEYKIALEKQKNEKAKILAEQKRIFLEKRKICEKLIKELVNNGIITDIDTNSLGQNVYYYDETVWYQTQYKHKQMLYEALKNLNSDDYGENIYYFYVKGSITGKTLIDILGVK